MIDKKVRNLLLTFFFCKMTKIINFLTNILVKKKKMCYNIIKLREKEQGTIMWALGFVPLVIMFYLYHTQRVKKLENKIKRIEQKQKGNKEMSRLLKELIGKNQQSLDKCLEQTTGKLWMLMRNGSSYAVLIKREKKNSNYNALRISKPLNLTESRCVTCN